MANKDEFNYQEKSQQLDNIIASLQNPDDDIDSAIKNYENGKKIIKEIEEYLTKAENKIKKLKSLK
ncbi:exodeoxyribonuclease VII small subunit [bacterium]|jgi:exodeoxyribonuclease VII small subunit|nr:exodeoxyribonuclease VII small subunit [bacterium]